MTKCRVGIYAMQYTMQSVVGDVPGWTPEGADGKGRSTGIILVFTFSTQEKKSSIKRWGVEV
jgi:hypothetical protein